MSNGVKGSRDCPLTHLFPPNHIVQLFGSPGGYGLMQIDWPANKAWAEITKKRPTEAELKARLRDYQHNLMWLCMHNLREGLTKTKEATKATKTLEEGGKLKFTQEQLERNVACRYNSSENYYYWDTQALQWLKIQYPVESKGYKGQKYADKVMSTKNQVVAGEEIEWWNWESVLG